MLDYNLMDGEGLINSGTPSILTVALLNLPLAAMTLGLYPYLVARNSGVAITDERIIIVEGKMFGAKTSEIRHENVQSVQTSSGGLLSPASLEVTNSAGETMSVTQMDPDQARNAINEAQRAA